MLTHDGTSDDSASTRARVIVSLNYVQVLRREIEAGRVSQSMFEDYLARLECHLLNIERSSLVASGGASEWWEAEAPIHVEDRLVSERIALN